MRGCGKEPGNVASSKLCDAAVVGNVRNDENELSTTSQVHNKCRFKGSGSPMSLDSILFINERLNSDISSRYDLDPRELGAGGFGRVYLARDRMFQNRIVAIKKIVRPPGATDGLLSREVDIMKQLDHPAICKLFETYRRGRLLFFVLEYCAGGDLYDHFSVRGGASETTVAAIAWQLASALAYAHWRGIAHRDLKLENICFIHESETCNDVKVVDWGFGKMFSEGRMISQVGTQLYSAPEVWVAEESVGASAFGYTSACDLWSLGVLTYVLLSGKPPFWGGAKDQLRRMRTESYPISGGVWDNISIECKDFIRHLLRLDPALRYTAKQALQHPWLSVWRSSLDMKLMRQVLSNAETFSRSSRFFALCVLSVARQVEHASLTDVRSVFNNLDLDGNGVLTKDEISAAFKLAFSDSELDDSEVDEIFRKLDSGRQGSITYTEFCAAGLSPENYTQEHVLWAAFKTFDIHDRGRISLDEMHQLLSNVDLSALWTKDVAEEVMNEFGGSDKTISFQEWLNLMKSCSKRHLADTARCGKHALDVLQVADGSARVRKANPCLSGLAKCLRFLASIVSD